MFADHCIKNLRYCVREFNKQHVAEVVEMKIRFFGRNF